jgi:EAL domain-containing protein (putative c-di-GMP-specific phosphodiesterase class I)
MKQINLSIDDFGMGYSMMQQLRNVPATELKVDKSFVQGIHESERDRTIVQKTIEIGHETGLMVIGEGVETAEQFDFLKRNHCDAVQGFLYSRPLPACEMRQWLGHYRRESLRA